MNLEERGSVAPSDFLPLHPFEYRILLVLLEGSAHGYGIVKAIEARDSHWKRISPANLYRRLRDLLASGLIEDSPDDADDSPDPRRRYFRITRLGQAVARLEARRLAALVEDSSRLLGGA